MELFLMVLFVSLLCLVFSALAFSAAAHEEEAPERATAVQLADSRATDAPRFFAEHPVTAPAALNAGPSAVTAEALRLQIEQHIRLEHAAAEAFLERPTRESLHSRTTSPLLN